jgi:signal transduction histidine kinase
MEYACHSPTEQRWFILQVVPLLGANQGAVVIHQNVTLIHQARVGLIESEQRFRAMAEMSADWYWEQDSQFRFTRIDRGPKHDTLPNVGNWIGKTRWDAQTPGLGVADWDAHRAALAAHAEFRDFEYRVKSSDGTISWISIRGAPRFDGGGVFCGYHGVGTNISQRKEQEEKRALLAERLAELSRRLVQAQEQARHHLARELHELTSPNLAALRINLAILAKATPIQREDQDFVDRVADTRALIDDTTSNIRDICAELHSTALEGGGMVGVVENYAQQFAKRTSIKVTVHCAHAEVHLAPALALPLFRIVQEALTNCAKHAQARTVDITLQFASLPMLLQVRDDGVGFDPSPAQRTQAGLGLINMRETAEFVGGTLTLSSQAGIGTTVRVDIALPLPESAA